MEESIIINPETKYIAIEGPVKFMEDFSEINFLKISTRILAPMPYPRSFHSYFKDLNCLMILIRKIYFQA